MIPGLCAFLLGVIYEFNREPGEVTRCGPCSPDESLLPCARSADDSVSNRSTIHPILTRLGMDVLSGRVIRLRDDDRFRAVGPDNCVVASPTVHLPPHHAHQAPPVAGQAPPKAELEEGEIWFDWAFVDFWKSNYCKTLSPLFWVHCSDVK